MTIEPPDVTTLKFIVFSTTGAFSASGVGRLSPLEPAPVMISASLPLGTW